MGRLDDAKRRKKRGWPNSLLESLIKNELKLGKFTDKKLVLMKMTEVKGQPSFTTHNTIYYFTI